MPLTISFAERIRRKIDREELPRPTERTYQLWMQTGDAHACDGCDNPIKPPEVSFEVELDDRRLYLDARCLALWYEQRTHAPDHVS